MQCGQTQAIRRIRVRPFSQKEDRQRFVSSSACDQERAPPVGPWRADIRTSSREQTRGVEIALLSSEQEWREAGLRPGFHVGAMFDKVSRNRRTLFSDCPH